MFVLKHALFMEKELLLEDSGSKVELEEVRNAETNKDHLTLIGRQWERS